MLLAGMKFNLENIARESLKKKSVIIKKLNADEIKVFYLGTSIRNTPKPVTFPKITLLDENLAENIGMYIGDGKFGSKDMVHSEFITTDEDMALFFLNFLKERFFIDFSRISFIIKYRNGHEKALRNKWSDILKVPVEKFSLQLKHKYNMKDSITIQVNSVIFTYVFRELIKRALKIIKKDAILRKAFLRGFFAADGKLGVEKDTNTFYISEMTFCYNYKTEKWLRDYIIECLKIEGIKHFNLIQGYIRITGWENYLRFWEMRLLDLCARKKNRFLRTINQMFLYFKLNKNFLSSHLSSTKISKNSLLEMFNLHRTNLHRVLDGKQLLRLDQIETFRNVFNIKWKDILSNMNGIRIGKQTYLNPQEDFINFVIDSRNSRGE